MFAVAKIIIFCLSSISIIKAGISPVHDFFHQVNNKQGNEKFIFNSPHKVLKHLDTSIQKSTSNVTQNPEMDENLYQLSKDLVTAILSKLEIQDKITRITREALSAPGKVKGMAAIETRRILDYISKTLSGHILNLTRASTEPELHRLVFGLAQIAAEVSIVSALRDITYATSLSKKQSVDLSFRKKRETSVMFEKAFATPPPESRTDATEYKKIAKNPVVVLLKNNVNTTIIPRPTPAEIQPYSILSRDDKKHVHVIVNKKTSGVPADVKGFLNKTALDIENQIRENKTDALLLENNLNTTQYVTVDSHSLDTKEISTPNLIDEWIDHKDYSFTLNPDVVADMEMEQADIDEDVVNEKKAKQKMERLELKAKKAILYAGDVAFLAAASVIAMRRALTASVEVQMSVKYAKNGMSNHQDLMMNLAKTAAQQAGKEAKGATAKSLASERVIKLALKYTAQSNGANLNHVANRIVMESLSLATLAKSMAFVSSDIAINSLYLATDVKPPS